MKFEQPTTRQLQRSKAECCRWLALGCCLSFFCSLTGCQGLKPFQGSGKSMTQRLSQQWNKVGLDALCTGRLSQAKSFFSRAAAENPHDQLARFNLARTLRQEGDLPAAIVQMQQGLELAGNSNPNLISELGQMHLDAGQHQQAQHYASQALSIDHRCAAGWALQGKLYQAQGAFEPALTAFHRALSLDPSLVDLQLEIAAVYQASGQPVRALSALEKVLHRFPLDQQPETALLAKGEVLMQLQQVNSAIEVLQLASEREQPSKEVLLRLAEAQVLGDHPSQARQTLNRALELYPQEPQCVGMLAQLAETPDQVVYR